MKTKILILFVSLFCATNIFAQKLEYKYKKGDPRNEFFSTGYSNFKDFVDRYEKFREPHENVLKRIGPDTLWAKEVELAKKEGGYVVEAVINPYEDAELCMSPADAEKVTHLKLTGRAYKWGEYTIRNMELFIRKLKKLKVLNLRDLDCELLLAPLSEIEVPKLILPANCKVYGVSVTSCFTIKEVVFNEDLEAIASIVEFGPMRKEYTKSCGLHTLDMKDIVVPPKVEFIGGITFYKNCETLTLPNSVKEIGDMETAGIGFAKYDLKNLKKIRINRAEPPYIEKLDNRLKYEQTKNVILSVPKGCKEAYSKHLVWRLFNIIEEGEPPVEEVLEDSEYSKDVASLLPGKWNFQKEHLIDNKGHFKDRKPYNASWWEFKNDEFTEGYYEDGVEKSGSLKYELKGNQIYLKLDNGILIYDIEKITTKDLELSVTNKRNGYDYKLTFYFTR